VTEPSVETRERWLTELTAAMRAYCFCRPEHRDSAACHLKQTITGAYSYGVLTDEDMKDMMLDGELRNA